MPKVRHPSRYIGGEINQIQKDFSVCDIRIALCFPDIYEVAMSYTGLGILYEVLNGLEGIAAERAFAPWIDAEPILRQGQIPLFTLESMAAVRDFDLVGFSLTNELCYTNLLNMLDLAGIPIRARDRTETDPIVVVGGQSANCAEPIAEFVDMFVLGDGEEVAVELVRCLRECRDRGLGRQDFLSAAAKDYSFMYVPSLYRVQYDGLSIQSIEPTIPGLGVRRTNAIVEDLNTCAAPQRPIVPFVEAIHDRISIEVMRGCPGRCRFCQASFCRRPIRFRSPQRIVELAKAQYSATAYDTIGLLSLSTADYPQLEELVLQLNEYFAPRHVGVSLPSLKVQQQLRLLPKMLTSVRKGGLTIAVEAASERLRGILNKPISNKDLFAAVDAAYQAGFQQVKLYFMVGLPGETEDDIVQIVDLSYAIAKRRRPISGRNADIHAAVSWLVPKPHTPFGWFGQQSREYFLKARQLILDRKKELNARCVAFKFHTVEISVLESAMGRGDRRLADVIETAWRRGARFDLWNECFELERWRQAFAHHGMDLDMAAQRTYMPDDILPWDHLGGPEKETLRNHYLEAIQRAGSITLSNQPTVNPDTKSSF
ncbi:MAG: TIGR03960 family B12-binding radical SAM protein [Phycisphaerae bacterium]|nr:TIGR03960 family B12-binding radical SAM protein [Phycisphaerae bacterium]